MQVTTLSLPIQSYHRQRVTETAEFLMKNFFLFSQMPQFRVEKICTEHMRFQVYERAGENVVLEDMVGDCVYFVTRGLFVSQKAVTVDSLNFWPRSPKLWESQRVQREVLFTANRMEPASYFGEKEAIQGAPYTLGVCSAERDCELLHIPNKELAWAFSDQEVHKLRSLGMVQFPNEEEIKNKILIIEKIMTMKKNAFLNATNTNFLPKAMRDFYLDPVTRKLYKWVQGIRERTREKVNTAVQQKERLLPAKEAHRFHDDRERLLLLPAGNKPFKVLAKRRDNYQRSKYKRHVKERDATATRIAEEAIQRIVSEIAFK